MHDGDQRESLRDYFAAHALRTDRSKSPVAEMAREAYELADAMLEAREKNVATRYRAECGKRDKFRCPKCGTVRDDAMGVRPGDQFECVCGLRYRAHEYWTAAYIATEYVEGEE